MMVTSFKDLIQTAGQLPVFLWKSCLPIHFQKKKLLLTTCLLPWCLWSWYPVNRQVLWEITGLLLSSLQFGYWVNWSVDDTLNMEQPDIMQHFGLPGDKLLILSVDFSSAFHTINPNSWFQSYPVSLLPQKDMSYLQIWIYIFACWIGWWHAGQFLNSNQF